MSDLDRIAAWIALEVADKGPLMNNPNHWGARDWERLWAYVRDTAPNKQRSQHRKNVRAAEHVMRYGGLPPGDYPNMTRTIVPPGTFT